MSLQQEQGKTQIGELFDTLIEEERRKANMGLTTYIEEIVSDKSDLSSRQIGRLRTISSDFPEGDAVEKLTKAIPQVSILDPASITNRLLWDWRNIEYDQQNLISNKTERVSPSHAVAIFSGWEKPIGLENESVVRSIARNIPQGFTYEFIYPDSNTYPKNVSNESVLSIINSWVEELRKKVSIAWLHDNSLNIDRLQLSDRFNEFIKELDVKINFNQTPLRTDLWLRMPSNYCVLYNLGDNHKENKFRYGSFRVTGQLIRSPSPMDSIPSSGWLYTTDEQYKLIEDGYKQAFLK
jgi:hypothetical protein